MRRMFSLGKEEFITAFDKWCDKWKGFLDEWTLLISGKTTYTHRRLRTVRRSIKTHLTWLYTCEEHPEIQIPNTTNLLEGLNSQLETSAKPHINSEIINITHWLSIVVLSVKRLLQRSQNAISSSASMNSWRIKLTSYTRDIARYTTLSWTYVLP